MTADDKSLGDAATFAGVKARAARDEVSLGDERTFGGGDAAGVDTLLDDIEIVDLAARYKVEGTLGEALASAGLTVLPAVAAAFGLPCEPFTP